MLFIKAFTSYFHINRPPTPSAVASPIVRHHHLIAPTAQYITMRKTAEERFNMLARGWLAYPVTSMHAQLPPKSGCTNVIPRFAYPVTPCAIRRERSLRFPEAPLFALINYCFLTA